MATEPSGNLFGLGAVSALRLPKTADVVAAQLRTFILARRLAPGTPLMGERKLIEYFKVSRASVREALRILEAEGIIEVRRGVHGGVFSAAPTTDNLTRGLATLLAYRQAPLSDLMEVRFLLEPEAAAAMARQASEAERQRLLDMAHSDETAALANFHPCIGELCGNPVMGLFLGAMRDIVAEAGTLAEMSQSALALTQKAHIRIAGAIAAGNERAARKAMENHLRAYADEMVARDHDTSAPIISVDRLSSASFSLEPGDRDFAAPRS